MSQPILVFDLDGTLASTAGDLLASLNHVLAQEGLPLVNAEGFTRHVGQGGKVMLDKAYAAAGRDFTDDIAANLIKRFVTHYGDNMPGTTKPFDGALECIERFQDAGYLCAICTNKTEAMAKRLLSLLEIEHLFAAIAGGDTYAQKKPHPDHLLFTIRDAGGDASRALMIGDSFADIEAAKAANIPVIGVSFGYTPDPIESLGPDHVIDHYDELTLVLAEKLMTQPNAS